MKAAKLRGKACIEEIDFRASRGLDKSVIRVLAQESVWVAKHENIFVLGPTGLGKSFVASALAQKGCRNGYSVFYVRAQSLFRDLALARADGSLRHQLAKLGRIDVMVIDDWAMAPLAEIRTPGLLGNLRGALPAPLNRADFAAADLAVARTDR